MGSVSDAVYNVLSIVVIFKFFFVFIVFIHIAVFVIVIFLLGAVLVGIAVAFIVLGVGQFKLIEQFIEQFMPVLLPYRRYCRSASRVHQ